ncbi:MAG: allantoicase [Halioglobus sp.]
MSNTENSDNPFAGQTIDLLNERVGGKALECSDEWFAECAGLVKQSDPVFKQGHFVPTGQWMDGWESRRSYGRAAHRSGKRDYDWCTLKLGMPGVIKGFDIETTHFRGNAPEYASIEGAWENGDLNENTEWFEVLGKQATAAHSHNFYAAASELPCTHLRLKIFPDGGVARLRAYGNARVNPANFIDGELLDLASVMNGGVGLDCSDRFYSSPSNLLMPNKGINMGDGWETKRRRDEDNDWCIVKLGLTGTIRKVIIDTAHFKGNFPDTVSLEATLTDRTDITAADIQWHNVIGRVAVNADAEHLYIKQIQTDPEQKFNHVRLNIYPDGGISRLRILGFPDWKASGVIS